MLSKERTLRWSLAIAMLFAVGASAQQPQAPRPGLDPAAPQNPPQTGPRLDITVNRPISSADAARSTDNTVADLLAICNQKEVSLAEIVKPKLEDKRAKEFADMMIKHHGQTVADLRRFGGEAGLNSQAMPSGAPPAPTATQPSAAPLTQPAGRQPMAQNPAQPSGAGQAQIGGFNFVEAQRRIAQLCLANAKKEWNDKKEECDMAYLGQQVVAHQEMVDSQKVLRDYVSPEFRPVIDKGIETAQSHLEHAKELLHSLAQANQQKSSDSTRR